MIGLVALRYELQVGPDEHEPLRHGSADAHMLFVALGPARG